MRRGWIVGGWLIALLASALPPLYFIADRVQRNHLGKFVDPETGAWTSAVYTQFFTWWSPIAAARARLHGAQPARGPALGPPPACGRG